MLAAAVLVAGCNLMPKPVEIGQQKVRAVPAKSSQAVEAERQAAQLITQRTSEARDAVLLAGATNALPPLTDARDAALGLSYSLGAPLRPWESSGAELSARLGYLEAKLDRALSQYRADVAPNVGKKIEGTGLLQIPYFLWIALVAGGLFLVWTGIQIVGAVYPPVGLGVRGLSAAGRIGGRTAARAFEQVVRGGEAFKDALDRSDLDDRVKASVLDMLRRHQMGSQDEQVQVLVRDLTR